MLIAGGLAIFAAGTVFGISLSWIVEWMLGSWTGLT